MGRSGDDNGNDETQETQRLTVIRMPVQRVLPLPPPSPPHAPRRRTPRRWRQVVVTLALMLALLVGGLTTPQGQVAAQEAADGNLALAGQTALNPQLAQMPSGPWDAQAGSAAQVLGDGGGAGPDVQAPGSAGLPVTAGGLPADDATPQPEATATATPRPQPTATPQPGPRPQPTATLKPKPTPKPSSSGAYAPTPPDLAQWADPRGTHSFRVNGSSGYYYWAYGQCTWWAQDKRRDENLRYMGNARYWASGARGRGYHVSSVPRKGATVVFQPGVQGAGGAGHVAHVEQVYRNGWFLVSEMNFYWNGGGWGRVSYRYAHVGEGVSFIY